MSDPHDPNKQVGYLQQCLSSDKKPLGLFLGAGCPVAILSEDGKSTPLIPDIAGITKIVRENLGTCKECGPLLKIVESHFKTDGRLETSVEDILSHIRALRAVAGKDKVRELTADNLDKLDDKICSIIHTLADKSLPHTKTPYHRIASWVDDVGRDKPVEIFTTNYDRSSEDYHHTLFHEMTHATGHGSRLDRDGVTNPIKFGSERYSKEELIAELGAAFLSNEAGILDQVRFDNSAAYLESWIKNLKDDPTLIVSAASQAQRGFDWVTGQSHEVREKFHEQIHPVPTPMRPSLREIPRQSAILHRFRY
jgi:hypothetical protein